MMVCCKGAGRGRILLLAMLLLGGTGFAIAGVEASLEAGIEAYKRGDYIAARAAAGPGLEPGRAAGNRARRAARMTPAERAARRLLAGWEP